MSYTRKHTVLYIVLSVLVLIIGGIVGYGVCLSHHYKQVIAAHLPEMMTKSTDSIYHISYSDIYVSLVKHELMLTDVKIWPDEEQVKRMKQDHRHVPPTLHTVSVKTLEATGINWDDVIKNKTLDCEHVTVHDLKWLIACHPNPADSTFTRDPHKQPKITRIAIAHGTVVNPDVTYHYIGAKENFYCYMKGGSAELTDWSYNMDEKHDTSTFLFAHSGKVRFASLTFSKPAGLYVVQKPDVDFESTDSSVVLKNVRFRHMVDHDQKTKKEKEIYDLFLPRTELKEFNWYRLVNGGELKVPRALVEDPQIDIHYIRDNNPRNGKSGAYPNQLLLEVGLKTNIEELDIRKGHFKYTEVTPKGNEGVIEFTGIHGRFSNATNIPAVIDRHKDCIVKLEGKYMNKSDVDVTFHLSLANKKGGFSMDGTVSNLNGEDVTPQTQAFTIVKVTSFQLNKMNIHIQGDEDYGKGDFTVLYQDLKISLLKFDTKMRDGKKGLFAFLGSSTILYPNNPMPGKDVRKVSTSFARDTTKGFIGTVWQHMYRAAKKTAVRQQELVTLTDGPETSRGQQPKKGFLKKLFGKKKNS